MKYHSTVCRKTGRKVISAIRMPNTPTVALRSLRYPCVATKASESAPPTTGTKLPIRNFAALEATVSLPDATIVWSESSPTKRVSSSPSAHDTADLIAPATADTSTPGARFPTTQKAR